MARYKNAHATDTRSSDLLRRGAAGPELPWPDPDHGLLEADQDDWQDAQATDALVREHLEPHQWE